MRSNILFSTICLFGLPSIVYGACSNANLTRCLDSVCALNISSNAAARCQYCGTSSAGTPSASNVMKSISAGSATKYMISDKELKKAPSDPGERYIWGTQKCLEKLSDCTADDVTDIYDTLIEQSCKAAGISAKMSDLSKKVNAKKTKSSCSTEISACLINEKHCLADYTQCETDADFDKHFADCSVLSTGCEEFLSDIRSNLISSRDSIIKNANQILENIVLAYQTARQTKLTETQSACTDNSAKLSCIKRACSENMPNKCEKGYEYEETLAGQLCEFYDIACERLK